MKQVESVVVCHSNSGIVELIINTRDKWVNYHQRNDAEYELEYPTVNSPEETDIPIGEELKFDKGLLELNPEIKYFKMNMQEKDQIIFLWIPYQLIREGRITKTIYP